jgi:hypothetical protein
MYAGAPLAFGVFRLHHNERPRAYRLPAGEFWSPVAFFVANVLIFWAGWVTVWKLGLAILIGWVLIGLTFVFKLNPRTPALSKLNWRAAQWLPFYLIGLGVITWQGTYGGGAGHIKLGVDFLVLLAFSLIIYYWARAVALPKEETERYIDAAASEVVPEVLPEH